MDNDNTVSQLLKNDDTLVLNDIQCTDDATTISPSENANKETVNHPSHYNMHPKGIEVIDVIEHMDFCTGNAIKYIMRAEHKNNEVEDLKKAVWYLNRKIETLSESKK
jgi:hypothetical protein